MIAYVVGNGKCKQVGDKSRKLALIISFSVSRYRRICAINR